MLFNLPFLSNLQLILCFYSFIFFQSRHPSLDRVKSKIRFSAAAWSMNNPGVTNHLLVHFYFFQPKPQQVTTEIAKDLKKTKKTKKQQYSTLLAAETQLYEHRVNGATCKSLTSRSLAAPSSELYREI